MSEIITPTSIDARSESASVWSFHFGLSEPLDYRPGQCITVRLEGIDDPRGPQRPFTLSSSPSETDYISITTKMTGSPFKEALKKMATDQATPGEQLILRGPMGNFTLETSRPAVMIAGGIGITPFRSMIRFVHDTGGNTPVTLLYSNDTVEDIAFDDELNGLAESTDWLTVSHTITQPSASKEQWNGRTGRIDGKMIAAAAEKLEKPVYYVCGPPGMVSAMSDLIQSEFDIDPDDLRSEKFSGY